MRNPAFGKNSAFNSTAQFSENMVSEAPLTVENAIVKSAIAFMVLVGGAAFAWMTIAANPSAAVLFMVGAGLGAFVLAMVNIFKREPVPGLVLGYAALEGMFVGALSQFYETAYSGIVFQAVLATFVVVGVTLALFASGKIRASARATKIFMIAMIGYLVFSIINMFLVMFGTIDNPWGVRGMEIAGIPFGIILGIFVVIMGAYSLVLDFDSIQQGVANRVPAKYAWTGAFGIMVTVVWLYLEILRMLAIARD